MSVPFRLDVSPSRCLPAEKPAALSLSCLFFGESWRPNRPHKTDRAVFCSTQSSTSVPNLHLQSANLLGLSFCQPTSLVCLVPYTSFLVAQQHASTRGMGKGSNITQQSNKENKYNNQIKQILLGGTATGEDGSNAKAGTRRQ